ncbi:hypothetical protein PN36_04910 [Candidatus Thiomargarita nelsonii]|uniref:Uncharacterized protein n=1 Tax=Candidatus Thiomargarita nelsonii TaxID=1003181 RepID=A0A0A6P4X3_9GAMM|nr:hypothetical protein PN36_04910 [Candidatus Thiomargarita nelsonii]
MQKLLTSLLLVISTVPTLAEDRALLVGIDTYQYVSPLRGSQTDVEEMLQFIQKVWNYQPHQIRTLIDEQATRENILNSIDDWLIKETQHGDRVFFYYSGHGYYIWDDNGDETDGYDETLCPVETKITSETMIRDDEIEARLRRLEGRKVTLVIDACHSGTVTRTLTKRKATPIIKIPVLNSQKVFKRPKLSTRGSKPDGFISSSLDVIAYSAVAPNQVALVDTETPYRGVFTRRFIEGVEKKLADSNFDGQVSHAELLEYIRTESQAYCDRHTHQCTARKLSPQLEAKPEVLAMDVRSATKIPQTNQTTTNSLLVHDNQANLQLEILPDDTFQIGDSMKIRIHSDHDGYFLLFDINSVGELTRLFPNEYSELSGKNGYVRAKTDVIIPTLDYGFKFTVQPPLGKGLLIALVVEDDLPDIQKLLPEAIKKQLPSQKAQAVLQQLRQQLNQTLAKLNKNEEIVNSPVRWSITVKNYEIVRQSWWEF